MNVKFNNFEKITKAFLVQVSHQIMFLIDNRSRLLIISAPFLPNSNSEPAEHFQFCNTNVKLPSDPIKSLLQP